MINIKQNIKEAFTDNKYLILFSVILFLSTLLVGYFLNHYLYHFFYPVVNQLSDDLNKGVISFSFQTIFLNNILIVFRLFIFGLIFCFSILILAYNGIFLGYFIGSYGNLLKAILYILPHGIFELSSIVIANASGLVLFKYFFYSVTLKNLEYEKEELIYNNSYINRLSNSFINNSKYLKEALILLAISCILMIIAGFVEVYLTKSIAIFFINLLGLK